MGARPDPDRLLDVVTSRFPGRSGRPDRRIGRDVNLLALGHQAVAGERIGVFAANQHANPADRRLDDAQTCPVSARPHQLLIIGRNQLAMVIEQRSIFADQHVRIPDAANARFRPLVEPQRDAYFVPACSIPQPRDLRPCDLDGAGGELLEQLVGQDRRRDRRPDRKRRHERLREDDQPRSGLCGLRDQRACLVDRSLGVEKHRSDVGRGNF